MKSYYFLMLFFSVFFVNSCNQTHAIKTAQKSNLLVHVAHLQPGWYPQNKDLLQADLESYFNLAQKHFPVTTDATKIKALIVPHAGMYYSGLCAATAYQAISGAPIKRVIILSPSHTLFLKGCALPNYDIYQTVLGSITVDDEAIKILEKHSSFKANRQAHDQEHAIEIQLPFLQKTLSNFTLVPLIVGHVNDEDIDDMINGLKKVITNDTLIVISSDFIHYGASYEYKIFSDNILNNIKFFDSLAVHALSVQSYSEFEQFLNDSHATICGQNALKVLLGLINTNTLGKLNTKLTGYYTSAHMGKARMGDTSINIKKLFENIPDQEIESAVSYVGMVFTQQELSSMEKRHILSGYEQKSLLHFARSSIENSYLPTTKQIPEHLLFPVISTNLLQPVGAFVTLNTKQGDLRGCIGRISTSEPLFKTVMNMAKAAAFNDSRFSPVKKEELENVIIDISILSQPMKVASYHDIKIGKHGVILNKLDNGRISASAVFLPQVAPEYGWNTETTLEHLSQKAGLAKDAWKSGCEFEVFEGYEIKET